MNVYDLDHTIYPGDSTLDFWRFCVKRWPAALLPLPWAALSGGLFHAKLCSRETFKGRFYRFLRHVPNAEAAAAAFWEEDLDKIRPWYLEQKRPDDLVISASPDFLVLPACRALGIRGIASPVSPDTGALLGPNCRGTEKAVRLAQTFPGERVEGFWSDSLSDVPLARLAERAYLVKNGVPGPWPAELLR